MPYIFGKLWHLAIIWAIRKAFQCILQCVRFLLANHTRLSPTSENDSYAYRYILYMHMLFTQGTAYTSTGTEHYFSSVSLDAKDKSRHETFNSWRRRLTSFAGKKTRGWRRDWYRWGGGTTILNLTLTLIWCGGGRTTLNLTIWRARCRSILTQPR